MVATFCGRLMAGERPTVYGDGLQTCRSQNPPPGPKATEAKERSRHARSNSITHCDAAGWVKGNSEEYSSIKDSIR